MLHSMKNHTRMGKKYSILKPEVVEDLRRNTEFSVEEIKAWHAGFIKDCPRGYITIKEFKDIYVSLFPDGDSSQFAEYTFRTFDTDSDRMIQFQEFMHALNITARGNNEQKLKWAFGLYDIDRNGYISRKNMFEIVSVSMISSVV